MKPSAPLGFAVKLAIAALVLLGLLGGSLIVAYSGFATSSKTGGPSVFVPAPMAYVLAAIMYAMSAIGLLALLREREMSIVGVAVAFVFYASAAAGMAVLLQPG